MTTRRPVRSLLAVPATSRRSLGKAAEPEADGVFLDLQDAVIAERKTEERKFAIQSLNELDWGDRNVVVRVDSLATAWRCRDILELVATSPRLECDSTGDVYAVSMITRSAEQETTRQEEVALLALIETTRAVAAIESIAQSGERLSALVFGSGDYQLDLGRFQHTVGAPSLDYVFRRKDGNPPAAGRDHKRNHVAVRTADCLGKAHARNDGRRRPGGRGAAKNRDGEMIDLMHIKFAEKIIGRNAAIGAGGPP